MIHVLDKRLAPLGGERIQKTFVEASSGGLVLERWRPQLHGLTWYDVVLLTGVGNVFGQIGDLAESLLKRSRGVKDSGAILPGHGGLLDRVDAVLFVAPFFYVYALLR